MLEWIRDHIGWLVGLSAAMFVGTLIVVPILVVRIPGDYFAESRRHETPWGHRHPVIQAILHVAKNVVGGVLVVVGIVMLLLPGQGLLTIAIGLMLVDFPGKYRFERWLVSRPPVLRAINWLRRRAHRPPLVVDDHEEGGRAE